MPQPLITALLDTYNHERYIEQALLSALDQGLSPAELEIIVVDDGSTDKTPEIIQKFVPRVKHVRKPNGGQASAFNLGLAESHGEIIAFLDGDDWWAKGKLAKVIAALEVNPQIAAVGHGYYQFEEQTGESRPCVPHQSIEVSLASREAARSGPPSWPFLVTSALTMRRKALIPVVPIPGQFVFMADTVLQAGAMAAGALILPEALFYYRHHSRNLYAAIAPDKGVADDAKLRRKYEMTEMVYAHVQRMLLGLHVPPAAVAELLDGVWVESRRARLSRFGGSRRLAFLAEMQNFRAEYPNPTLLYRLFKCVTVTAGMLLPPRRFYQLRDWYARKRLARYRSFLFKSDPR